MSRSNKSLIPKSGNDKIYTPDYLAKQIVYYFSKYFKVNDIFLEPAKGDGSFYKYFPDTKYWCEIDEGRDFFVFNKQVDWIITNPPFSLVRKYLLHSFKINTKNIVFLITINHILGLKARLRDIDIYNYGIKEVLLLDKTPKEFPQSGFQWGVVWLQKGYNGYINWEFNKFKVKQ